jgi:uncharacterized protein (TIGR04255 family)
MPVPFISSPKQEGFFTRFAGQVTQKGFSVIERLVPPGVPYPPFQPVYRFRKDPAAQKNYLYQVGAGIFSANALPPYKDWNAFRPIVREGLELLLQSRDPSEKNVEFILVSLRYLDLFTSEFTADVPPSNFISEILGFGIDLPQVITEQADRRQRIQERIQLTIPLKTGLRMALAVGEGNIAGASGVVMDTRVLTEKIVLADIDLVMGALDEAHSSIHKTFISLTEKIHAKMKPEGVVQ